MPDDDPAPANAAASRAYLDRMTLHHLRQLQDAVQGLMAAGDAVAKAGFEPVFDLTSAEGMSMSIDYGLPMTLNDWRAASPAPGVYVLGPDLIRPDGWPGAQPEDGQQGEAQKTVLADIIEDRRREEVMQERIREFWRNQKLTKPAPGLQQAASPTAAAEVRESDGGGGLAAPAPAVAPARPALPADLSPIEAHLAGMPRAGNWTIERDHQLVNLACQGWDMPTIAAEMGCDSAALRARYDRLTGLHPTDKTRRFGRETLLAAFARLMPAEG